MASSFPVVLIPEPPLLVDASLLLLISAAVTFLAGYFGLRHRQWAFWLLCAFCTLQVVEYTSESAYFSLVGPLSLKIGFVRPSFAVDFNLLAALVAVLAARAALQIRKEKNAGTSEKHSEA